MASRIDSETPSNALRRQAEQQPLAPVSSNPKAPGSPPKPIPKRAAPQPAAGQEPSEGEETRPAGRGLLTQVPAWGISMLLHIVVLLAMALIAGEGSRVEKPTFITSGASEDEEFSEFEQPSETPVEAPAVADPVADVIVTTDAVVTPVEVAIAADAEAAPLAVELTEFGSETALASDMMPTVGAVGGKGGGLGGRANPGQQAVRGGGGADTEAAVDRALKWIAGHQMPDGGWDFDLAKCPSCAGKCSSSGDQGLPNALCDRSGATALALLPFLGRGYTHRQGPYQKQVEGGIRFLVKLVADGKGRATESGRGSMYSHGIAGIALSECYAMSQDRALASPTQAALNYIMEAQDPVGGGWRYQPRQPGDTSVVGWQIMALKSGHMAYLNVSPHTIEKAIDFLDSQQIDEHGSGYCYASPQRFPEGSHPITASSAIGLLCRMYLGWQQDHPGLRQGATAIAKSGPTNDLYHDYYATQVLHHMGGDIWVAWNNKMKATLLKAQSQKGHEAGSWFEPFNEGHGMNPGGRLLCTTFATMILEVYYRHLPIYGNQSVQDNFRE